MSRGQQVGEERDGRTRDPEPFQGKTRNLLEHDRVPGNSRSRDIANEEASAGPWHWWAWARPTSRSSATAAIAIELLPEALRPILACGTLGCPLCRAMRLNGGSEADEARRQDDGNHKVLHRGGSLVVVWRRWRWHWPSAIETVSALNRSVEASFARGQRPKC